VRLETHTTARRTGLWRRADSSENVNATPASDIVWRTGRPAQLVSNKMSGFIQDCSTARNIVAQLWLRAPQQSHGAGDMRRSHRSTTEADVSVIGGIVTGTRTCAGCRDIRFDPITSIDTHWAAAAKVSNHVLARIQGPHGV
jgi:hypothetical protein